MSLIPLYEWLPEANKPQQLFILLHGEDAGPEEMTGLAAALRLAFPHSVILAPASGQVGEDISKGYEWFAANDLSTDHADVGLAPIMDDLLRFIAQAQARFDLSPGQTALAGFSQGAIMALEAVMAEVQVAGRVMAFSGRFITLPLRSPQACTVHLLHGQDDTVIPVAHAQAAHVRLGTLLGDSTIDVASRVGHELHPALVARAIVRLQTCVPLHRWQEVLGAEQGAPQGVTLH